MADYMDYPFLCDEKLGDRCLAQCQTCKDAQQRRQDEWRKQRETDATSTRIRETR
jgi:hypothetical protein